MLSGQAGKLTREAQGMINLADVNGGGRINYAEFVKMLFEGIKEGAFE